MLFLSFPFYFNGIIEIIIKSNGPLYYAVVKIANSNYESNTSVKSFPPIVISYSVHSILPKLPAKFQVHTFEFKHTEKGFNSESLQYALFRS